MQTQIAPPNSPKINLCSGSMTYDGDGETQPTEYSLATTHHSPKHDHQHTRKKRRFALETETPIQLPNRQTHHHTPPNSYRFNFSSHTHSHRKWEHLKSSAGTETPRKWVFSSRDFSNCKDKVVFVSYNILGVENASKHPDLYYKVPQNCLDWDCRKKLICKEITRYNPSILCFQEVDRFDDLVNILQKDGFSGVYQARTGEACDGCAIFWKTELFTILHIENIEFKKFDLRDNVAQLCVLKMKKNQPNTNEDSQTSAVRSSRNLLVGNIHVLFNPKRGDIKLGQVRVFLEKARKLSEEWGNIPTLIGGDLNSMPQSAMYHFLSSSELDVRLHDRRKISGQIRPLEYPAFLSYNRYPSRWTGEELRLATGTERGTHVKHQLKLHSAYLGVPGSSRSRDSYGEPLATTYHSQFMGTVDYIWHTEDLAPVRVLETLPIENLRKLGGLPSKNWGSDHLALVCELAFADDDIGD